MASRCGAVPFIDSNRLDEGDRLVRHLHQQIGLLLQLRHRRDVAVPQLEPVADLHHVVDDVVELLGESVDVLAVERGDERRVETPQDLSDQLVAAPLAGDDGLETAFRPVEQLAQPASAVGHVGRRVVEQREEPIVGRQQTEPHQTGTVVR